MSIRPSLLSVGLFLLVTGVCSAAEPPAPRIVNVYNFVRNSDFRVPNSQDVLFDCTAKQLELFKGMGLPATWALQYDALINPRYQKLFKEQSGPHDEIGAWWEIPRPLAEKAGLKWRGRWDWDSASNVGFSPGYTPDERRKLVDVYMGDFKAIFGYYPKTVGSWYIDEVTLAYMADKYGIVASCNCKDQVGTDGYTLHGGYWNGAYYPSRLNAYMPAQDKKSQIDVPVFRMLGSDPIHQYGSTRDMNTMEPVYPKAGGSADWVAWFMDFQIHQPCLAYSFVQVGQENSFGWDAMSRGLTMQAELLAKQSKAGDVQVETLATAGEWFRQKYQVTPPTCVVALDDWKKQDRKSVWYDSRFYRMNLLWKGGEFFIRDLHRFDEAVVSPTHDTVLTKSALAYGTLPVMDGARWSKKQTAGIWPVLLSPTGDKSAMVPEGPPVVKELNPTDLSVNQPLHGGGSFSIVCRESEITCQCVDGQGKPMPWAFDLIGGDGQKAVVQGVTPNAIAYRVDGVAYQMKPSDNSGTCSQLDDGTIRIKSGDAGKVTLLLGGSS
jgi:hypothetical protein